MATGINPVKERGSPKLAPRLAQMMDGWQKGHPATVKMCPVEVDVPECLAKAGRAPSATEKDKAIGDWALVAFYFLLRIGEYTGGQAAANSKQTVNYRLCDAGFFVKGARGRLRRLPQDASDEEILAADGATLKLDNMKNGWRNVCVHHEANGDPYYCPVKALARRFVHVRRRVAGTRGWRTFMSAYWEGGVRFSLTDKDMRAGLKAAADQLHYEGEKGIPTDRVDTHSLRMGGANALALAGYSDTQIQKMGRWRGATFKEYIREELACYSKGMTRSMRRKFGFVNVAAGNLVDITDTTVVTAYTANPSSAAAA